MENKETEQTLIIAASLAVSVALADLIITLVKRYKAQKRAEALPHNATTINRTPLYEEMPITQDEPAPGVQDETAGEFPSPAPP
jgi:hypothetical protein